MFKSVHAKLSQTLRRKFGNKYHAIFIAVNTCSLLLLIAFATEDNTFHKVNINGLYEPSFEILIFPNFSYERRACNDEKAFQIQHCVHNYLREVF